MLNRLLRQSVLAMRCKVKPIRNRILVRPFSQCFEGMNEQQVRGDFTPNYSAFLESLRANQNVEEANRYLKKLPLKEKVETIYRLLDEVQTNQFDSQLKQMSGSILSTDFISSLTMEVMDDIDTLDLKDISHFLGSLKSFETLYVLNKVFLRIKLLIKDIADKETLGYFVKCYYLLLPKLSAHPIDDAEFYYMETEILAMVEHHQNSWMDSDVVCQLTALIFNFPTEQLMDQLPNLSASILPNSQISEVRFFELMFCIYLSLKETITQDFESQTPTETSSELDSLHHRIFVNHQSLSSVLPESIEVHLLNALEQSTQFPDWRSSPEAKQMLKCAVISV